MLLLYLIQSYSQENTDKDLLPITAELCAVFEKKVGAKIATFAVPFPIFAFFFYTRF